MGRNEYEDTAFLLEIWAKSTFAANNLSAFGHWDVFERTYLMGRSDHGCLITFVVTTQATSVRLANSVANFNHLIDGGA